MIKVLKIIICFSISIFLISCKKLITIDPPRTELVRQSVFENDATANAAQLSIFIRMATDGNSGSHELSRFGGLASDEFTNYDPGESYIQLFMNNLVPNNSVSSGLWTNAYKYIYQANSIIEGVAGSTTLNEKVRVQLEGESKFVRAFWYFVLVNYYGDVPLVLTTDYQENALSFRMESSEVYNQIVTDLMEAVDLLNNKYVGGDGFTEVTERLRPNKDAARVLLARVYLFQQKWVEAEDMANQIIVNEDYALEPDLNNVFSTQSREAIWQLTLAPYNSYEGIYFIFTGSPSSFAISPDLLSSFENGDARVDKWLGSSEGHYYPYKYKVTDYFAPLSEYPTVFRLAEIYLIRSEARINQPGKVADGIADINIIRARARAQVSLEFPDPLPIVPTDLSQQDAIKALIHERRVELFSEWGHRWFDIKRWKGLDNPNVSLADEIMPEISNSKGGDWTPEDKLFPIPQNDIDRNPNLSQNSGY